MFRRLFKFYVDERIPFLSPAMCSVLREPLAEREPRLQSCTSFQLPWWLGCACTCTRTFCSTRRCTCITFSVQRPCQRADGCYRKTTPAAALSSPGPRRDWSAGTPAHHLRALSLRLPQKLPYLKYLPSHSPCLLVFEPQHLRTSSSQKVFRFLYVILIIA